MTGADRNRDPGFDQADWDEVSDNPDLTDEELASLRPASELPPEIYAALPGVGAGRSAPHGDPEEPTVQVTLRLNASVVAAFRASGPGWRERINDVLAQAVALSASVGGRALPDRRPDREAARPRGKRARA